MGQQSVPPDGSVGHRNLGRSFGRYLRQIREDRRLSLDAVEERSFGFPGRVTKSHLSRIETGQAVPTFPRMFTLSRIYGVPITQLAERFDLDLRTEMFPPHSADISDALTRARAYIEAGRYAESLQMLDAARNAELRADSKRTAKIHLGRITCLLHLGSYHSAKDEAELFLSRPKIPVEQRISGLYHLAQSGYRLGRFPVAELALAEAQRHLRQLEEEHPHHAMLAMLQGNLAIQMDQPAEAAQAYRQALQKFELQDNGFEACRTRLNLTSALIQTGHKQEAKRQLVRIVEKSRQQGWDRLTALALSNLALIAFNAQEYSAAEAYCLQSNTIARSRDYLPVVFRNCYYLWRMAQEHNDAPAVRTNLRTLKTYINRLEDALPEAEAFRAHLAGSES